MNLMHRRLCASDRWARIVAEVLPGALAGYPLGDEVLEVGPGFGATTRVLLDLAPNLTAIEIDPASARGLRAEFAERARIVQGSGASLPFDAGRFSAVVCFTMMHHVPTAQQQDAILAEACRVLRRPGGLLRGSDSQLSLRFRLLHLGDTMNVLDHRTLPDRLAAAGFTDIEVRHRPKQLVEFAARRPG